MSRNYKEEYKKFQSSPQAKKKRATLNKINRDKGTYGNNDNLDVSHMKGGGVKLEHQSKNRGNKTRTAGDRKARGGGTFSANKGYKLNKRQGETMKKHKEHHTDEHMKVMEEEMLNGSTFEEAHEIALKKVGN
tara:strand:+ start:468 stop:866 length:399 start_codon:yes stop_codon:yes gene_type:complete